MNIYYICKNENGIEEKIMKFYSLEEAKRSIPKKLESIWFIKEETTKASLSDTDISLNYKKEKMSLYDSLNNLCFFSSKLLVNKNLLANETEDKEALKEKQIAQHNLKRKIYYEKNFKAIEKTEEKKNLITQKVSEYAKNYCKKNLPPTEENGINIFLFRYYFIDINSKPQISKTYMPFKAEDEVCYFNQVSFRQGKIYPLKGFSITVNTTTTEKAEELIKKKLKELKKEKKQ